MDEQDLLDLLAELDVVLEARSTPLFLNGFGAASCSTKDSEGRLFVDRNGSSVTLGIHRGRRLEFIGCDSNDTHEPEKPNAIAAKY